MKCRIVSQESLQNSYQHLILKAPNIAASAVPGQFLMVKVTRLHHDPLLRRPISIMNAHSTGRVELLYKVVGRGTQLLSEWVSGAELDVIGPLGTGFSPSTSAHTALLVGGGIGIPPLIFLANHLKSFTGIRSFAFLGGRTGADILFQSTISQYCQEVFCVTETGELGEKGFVTLPLISFLDRHAPPNPVIYACGPDPMMKALHELAQLRQIPARLSLEEHMGCGVGACLGCVVETRNGFRRVCKDGPVFDSDQLVKWK